MRFSGVRETEGIPRSAGQIFPPVQRAGGTGGYAAAGEGSFGSQEKEAASIHAGPSALPGMKAAGLAVGYPRSPSNPGLLSSGKIRPDAWK